jgi:hypothetical protein
MTQRQTWKKAAQTVAPRAALKIIGGNRILVK